MASLHELAAGDLDPLRQLVRAAHRVARRDADASEGNDAPFDKEEVVAALDVIPATDRNVWLRVAMALHRHGAAGRDLWDSWSLTAPEKFDRSDSDRVWHSLSRPHLKRPTLATIFHLANGYDPRWRDKARQSAAREVFDPITPEMIATIPGEDARSKSPQCGLSAMDVLARMMSRGGIRHLPTGFSALDKVTGDGLPTGGRVVIQGPPDSGKTQIINQLADHYAKQGIPCGMLSVDEEDRDQLGRFLQRRGFSREQCEAVDPIVFEQMEWKIDKLPVRFYGPEFTIEAAASDLHNFARSIGASHAALFVDSVQTVRCGATNATSGRYEVITANVAALRAVAERHGFLVVATSEMNRGGYANPDKRTDEMATASGSGAIEYQARVLLSIRSVPGTPDLVELRVVKNKHGPRTPDDERGIALRLDRANQTLTEDASAVIPDRAAAAQAARQAQQSLRDAALLAAVVLKDPGRSAAQAESAMRAAALEMKLGGMSHTRFGTARSTLGGALVEEAGPRNATLLSVKPAKLSPRVFDALIKLGKSDLVDPASRAEIEAKRNEEWNPPPLASTSPNVPAVPRERSGDRRASAPPPAPYKGAGRSTPGQVKTKTTAAARAGGGKSKRACHQRTAAKRTEYAVPDEELLS